MTGPSRRERDRAAHLAPLLADWHRRAGRHDLPWQTDRSPYRVWVSEIMLQQTQVSTVMDYYQRFMARFPGVLELADASIDEVLHLWSGLGYYARARNLHRAAQQMRDQHGGDLPRDFAAVLALPGIGRSTAGAILALAFDERFPILDGNVKRVLTRYFCIEGDPRERATEKRLWELAEAATPEQNVATHTQAIMDLGATVCTARRPACLLCPCEALCGARRNGREQELPLRRSRPAGRARISRRVFALVVLDAHGAVLLERRPESGIWGGLWSLPEFDSEPAARRFALSTLPEPRLQPQTLATVHHRFTHFDLELVPLLAECPEPAPRVMEAQRVLWYNYGDTAAATDKIGLPAPIKTLLHTLSRKTLT